MGRPKGSNSQARERLIEAAGRGFRQGGFGGVGVDGLAKEAGLTSGAFYAHFGSKSDAFRLVVADGMAGYRAAIERIKAERGDGWREAFVDFYLDDLMELPLAEACALATFTTDAARADPPTREAYQAALEVIVEALADGFGGTEARARAWRLVALLAGATGMARAVVDPAVRVEILTAARAAALSI